MSARPDHAVHGVVPGTYVRLLYEYLAQRGVDGERLLGEPPPAGDRYPVGRWRQMLETAAAHFNDPQLGLRLGQLITPAHLGVMGYVLIACGNLGAAMQRFQKYQRLVYDVNPFHYGVEKGSLQLEWGVEHGRPGALADECAITALVQFARNLTGREWPIESVHFVNPEPLDAEPYRRYFGREVCFAQSATRVRISLSYLALPLRQPDPALLDLLTRQADTLLAALPDSDDFEQSVRRCVARLMREGEPSLERVADELHLSTRTLHRRLEERATNFRALQEDTRRRVAEDHLRDPRLQLAEIAQLLGFSEQSAFTRAFTRWTGMSPGRFRRQLSQAVK